ncbi:MAG: hydrogenase iron-sulfur subunit [Thermoplasmatales archaeon]|nr:hydrogenase iron-sulfur subunit [Thermoplasmatales archaeon]
MADKVLVIGGGIAGIQSSLDLAEAGTEVILVEKSASIGGKMAALDKNFPTFDCSICIEAPKMSDVTHNKNITVLTLAEVKEVKGTEGNFEITINQKPRFVTDACTRCDLCVQVCPQVRKNEFDAGVGARKAIHTPFSQAEPGPYVIDIESCLNEPPNYLPCGRCTDACGPEAIDFNMGPKVIKEKVVSIVVSTGFDLFNASLLHEFGYSSDPDILTSYELERMLNASGPTDGEIIKPSNGKHPEKVLFVLCAGSRDERLVPYCSRTCCMYSIKEASQLVEHGIKDVTVLYMDIRAYGKGFDELYSRSQKDVKYIRSRPGSVKRKGDHIDVRYATDDGSLKVESYDMVVLATASIPSKGTGELAKVLGIELSSDGFFKNGQEDPVSTTREGVYVAGCASGPKDIPDSVTEGAAASSKALKFVKNREWIEDPPPPPLDVSGEPRIGVFLCDCGSNIAGTVNVPHVKEEIGKLPNVVYVEENKYTCAGGTQDSIVEKIKEKKLNRVVVGACSPKTHGVTFQRVCSRAGLNPYLFEMANVRNMDSWVHKSEKGLATEKAVDMVDMAVSKSRLLTAMNDIEFPVVRTGLVIGGGPAGIAAATSLSNMGIETHLIEKSDRVGGLLNSINTVSPSPAKGEEILARLERELNKSSAIVHTSTTVKEITGFVGNFSATLSDGMKIDAGAIIIATGAEPYQPTEFGYGNNPAVLTSLDLEKDYSKLEGEKYAIISCVGSRSGEKGCSRFCCSTMLQQAIDLKEKGKTVRIFYKDIRTYERNAEDLYRKAGSQGVQFFRYDPLKPPDQSLEFDGSSVTFVDELSSSKIKAPVDHLVLNIGMKPRAEEIFSQLKLSRDMEGFLLESHPKLGPVEAAVAGVFLAGTAQGPKGVKESMAQGYATATKAAKLLFRGKINKEPIIPQIDKEKCVKCLRCADVCPYSAIKGERGKWIELVPAACMGCGNCVAECNIEGAISMPNFTDSQIMTQIDAATAEKPEEKLVVFACNWCSYAGADQAGISKIQYPPSARVIRTMCSSRISQKLVMYAFSKNPGAVLVTGCHINDCHYIDANEYTEKRVDRWKRFLEAKKVNPDRLQLWWVSAAEGNRFASKIREMDALIKSLSKEEIVSTESKLKGVVRR